MIGDHLGKRTQRIDYRSEIMDAVRERDGISKDGVFDVVGGYRNTVIKRIDDLIDEGFLRYGNRKLHLKYMAVEDHFMRILKLYRENVKNIIPIIKKNVKESGKPLFYMESAAARLGKDGRTGKPFTGNFHIVNESAKSDLVMIIYEVNMLMRAGTALTLDSLKVLDQPDVLENWDHLTGQGTYRPRRIQKEVVKLMNVLDGELKELEAKLRKMAGKKGMLVFEGWWQQQMFGLIPIKW